MIVIGHEPNRADLLNFLSGIDFSEAWANKVSGELTGHPVYFPRKDDYRKTKQAVGRPKDMADPLFLAHPKVTKASEDPRHNSDNSPRSRSQSPHSADH
jgi:hypothetical protein